jgi:dTDP-glucose pyrophosphorylase
MKKNLIVLNTISLREALEKLEVLKIKLLFVVNEKHQLIGTLTDGDIRRAIINGHNTDENVDAFMNTEPYFAYENDSLAYKLSLFDKLPIQYLVILNTNKEVKNIVSKYELGALPNYVILMAGGLGSRLGDLTKHTPKPLLKVGSKPILQNIIEQFSSNDIKKFIISVNYKSEMIKEYFINGDMLGVDIDYIEESKRLGTAGCLSLMTIKLIEPFFVMNGDILVDIDFKDMLSYHLQNNNIATMGVVKYSVNIPYGVIEVDQEKNIIALNEKPNKSYYINAGVYLLNPELIDMIPKDKFYDMPTLFTELKQQNKKIGVYDRLSNWLDIGHIDDYKKAQKLYE